MGVHLANVFLSVIRSVTLPTDIPALNKKQKLCLRLSSKDQTLAETLLERTGFNIRLILEYDDSIQFIHRVK